MTGLGGRLQKKLGSIEKACLAYQKIPSDDNFSRVAKTFYNAARKGVHGQRGITEFAHVVRVKSGRDVLQQLRASRKPLPPEVIREMAAIMCDPNAGTLQPKYYNEVNTICEGIVEYCERNGLPIESQQVRNMIEEKFFNDTGKELTKAQANQRAALNARGVHSASELSHLAVGHILDEVLFFGQHKNFRRGSSPR